MITDLAPQIAQLILIMGYTVAYIRAITPGESCRRNAGFCLNRHFEIESPLV